MDVLVTYDIDTRDKEGERRLARVAKVCEGYGVRVQYSVFECRLSEVTVLRLTKDLADAVEPSLDSVRLYRIHGSIERVRSSIGREPPHEWGTPCIV